MYVFVDNVSTLKYKVIVFDAKSGKRMTEISTDLVLVKGLNDGNSFIAARWTDTPYFMVDMNGNKKLICKFYSYYRDSY